ncbi:MAG: 6,7-dimethyl-8-ribityllumazine synthase [Candidatus Muiribacteriota bacterium]
MKIYSGNYNGKNLKVGIVASRFNSMITQQLIEGCEDGLLRNEVDGDNICLYKVPGCFEIPVIALNMAKSKKFDVIITLGAVIRGETPHFDFVASEVSKGVAQVSLQTGVPVIFGVITTDNMEQALERAGIKSGNKGFFAALSAIETADLIKK